MPEISLPDESIPAPQEGGSYTYDPASNTLTRNTSDPAPESAPETPPPAEEE